MVTPLILETQQPPLGHRDSHCYFLGGLVATPAALEEFGIFLVVACHGRLQQEAHRHRGIDFFQVFFDPEDTHRRLLFFDRYTHVEALLLKEYLFL